MRKSQLIINMAMSAYEQAAATKDNQSISALLTKAEKITIGRRILIAQAIAAGKTRMEINEKIGVSPNTFANIRQWIESEFSQYHSAHQPNNNPKSEHRRRNPNSLFSFDEMARRYPGHFLILSGIKELFD